MVTAQAIGGALRRVVADPAASSASEQFTGLADVFNRKWSYYVNNPYDTLSDRRVMQYLADYGLYRFTRPIYNPTRRLAKWYAGAIYGGPMSEDGQDLPGGIKPAIPFSEDTPAPLVRAATRGLLWGNWQLGKSLLVKYGSVLGSAFIEIVDDVERGKVYPDLVWTGHVTDLELDAADNVRMYEITYMAIDREGKSFLHQKRVDQEAIRLYRNSSLVEEYPNPYGFTPGIWVKHEDDGDVNGAGIMDADVAKLDELNSVAAHIADQIHKRINSVKTFATDAPAADISLVRGDNRDDVPFIRIPEGTIVGDLAGDLNLADALAWVDTTYGELERDYPELTFYQELREMTQATGPAIQGLLGDVNPRFYDAMSSYDLATTKTAQMLVAIGGYRAGRGDWGPRSSLSRHQAVFLGFDLDSYAGGRLDLAIEPRQLVTVGERERYEIAEIKRRALDLTAAQVQREAGYSDQEIEAMRIEKQEQALDFTSGLGRAFAAGDVGRDGITAPPPTRPTAE